MALILMRSHLRLLGVLALAAGLVALFLHDVDLRRVGVEIRRARPAWLAVAMATMFVSLAIRSVRWQCLLRPLGATSFRNAFRATAVGFAASSLLPSRAGEIIRPYVLSRHEPLSMAGAFGTIVLERLLDVMAVLVLLASFVAVFDAGAGTTNPGVFHAVKWAAVVATGGLAAGLGLAFVLAGDPARLGRTLLKIERVASPALAQMAARLTETFATGLAAVRRPSTLLTAVAWSLPLWLTIDAGIWAVAKAFRFPVPFTGSFLIVPLLVAGMVVPTPGSIGGFDEAFRIGATVFYGVSNEAAVGAALVLHAFSIGPSLALGLFFSAQEGLSVAGMERIVALGGARE